MSLELTPQLRLILLVGLGAVLALGGGMMFLMRSQGTAEAEPVPTVLPTLARASAVPAPAPPKAAATASKPAATPAREPGAKKAPKPAPKPAPVVTEDGFPVAIVQALGRAPVAVVALTAADSDVDTYTLAEAQAAASAAGAAFVRIDALDEVRGGSLARLLGDVTTPAVLVYRRPRALFLKFDGYVDKETVAQAVADALLQPAG